MAYLHDYFAENDGNQSIDNGKLGRKLFKGKGGGGGGGGTTTGTTYTSNIPEYAKPYVMSMLGAAQSEMFNVDDSGNITGTKPYVPYSTNPEDYVAGFSPLQQQSFNQAAGMKLPGQFGQATQLGGAAGLGSLGLAGQAAGAGQQFQQQATNPYAVQQYMNPYLQASLDPQLEAIRRQYDITGQQEQSAATQAGAFGGSREALMAAENKRAMGSAMNTAIGQGYNTAFNNAQSQMQFGANLGLQGLNTGLQGLGQANTAAGTLGNLGTNQLAAQQGIMNTQNLMGTQQQQQQQNIINQAIQDYATQQQYPMMQLSQMSGLLHGLPMQSTTTQQYQSAPSALSTVAGLGTGIAGLAALAKKEGGTVKSYAGGGITSIGNREAIAEDLSPQQLEKVQSRTLPDYIKIPMLAAKVKEQQAAQQAQAAAQAQPNQQTIKDQVLAQAQGLDAAESGLPQGYAQGGIVAFGEGGSTGFERGIINPIKSMFGNYATTGSDLGTLLQERSNLSRGIFTRETDADRMAREQRLAEIDAQISKLNPVGGMPAGGPALPSPAVAQPANPAAAPTTQQPAKEEPAAQTIPQVNPASTANYLKAVNASFDQSRKDLEGIKGYEGKYAPQLNKSLEQMQTEANDSAITREEAEARAAKMYKGKAYEEQEKTIRDRLANNDTEESHALGQGLIAMSEKLLSNPGNTGWGAGLGALGKTYGAELKEIKAARKQDEKGLADIMQARRLEEQGLYKEADRQYERGQDLRRAGRDKVMSTLSGLNADDIHKIVSVGTAEAGLGTDQAKTIASIGMEGQKLQQAAAIANAQLARYDAQAKTANAQVAAKMATAKATATKNAYADLRSEFSALAKKYNNDTSNLDYKREKQGLIDTYVVNALGLMDTIPDSTER